MSEKVTIVVPCQHCGETARQELTLEEARLYALKTLALACDVSALELWPVQVGGE